LILDQGLGLKTQDKSLELYTSEEDDNFISQYLQKNQLSNKKLVVIHPGGRHWFKCWPKEKWVSLINKLQERDDLKIIVVGGMQDQETVNYICRQTSPPAYSLAGPNTLLLLAALLKKSFLFIGNDSSPMHIAAAMGNKVIALFGPTELIWKPWGAGHQVISKHVSCSPCSQTECAREKENCMELISVDEVLRAANQYF
jgi:ADP-heptose:LPS heptosyltransferase